VKPALLAAVIASINAVPAADSADVIVIHAARFERTYKLSPGIESLDIDDATIHANLRRGDERYIVLSYSEPYGKAGIESYLVWLHIRGSTVVAMQRVHYESQYMTISGVFSGWSGHVLGVAYDHYTESTITHAEANFDSQAPERGLTIVTQPPKEVPK